MTAAWAWTTCPRPPSWDGWAWAFVALVLALGAAFTTGCGPSLKQSAARAADRWEAACGVRPRPSDLSEVDAETVPCPASPRAIGCTTRATAAVTVAGRAPIALDLILLHEFGHVLGAFHHNGRGTLQARLRSNMWVPCLTQRDLDAVGICLFVRPEC